MATSTLAKSPLSDRPYDGNLISELIETVEKVEQPKPPQPDPAVEITSRTDEERRASNAEMLNALWILGEQMAEQAIELPRPKPDPLTVALNGFPDVFSSWAYQQGR
jgi:hypothetical protein